MISPRNPTTVSAVILDVDGTLVDSNDAHAYAWVEALEEEGIRVRFRDVRSLIGMGSDLLLPHVARIPVDSERGKHIIEEKNRVFLNQYFPALRAFPKARELIQRLHDQNIRLAVASSSASAELQDLLALIAPPEWIHARIEIQVSRDDVEASKPEPDLVDVTLSKLGLPADQVLMLGDTPYDIEAAAKMGVCTVALRSGGWNDRALEDALAVFDSPEDLLRQFDVSPFVHRRRAAAA